jgi:hypothetical protein
MGDFAIVALVWVRITYLDYWLLLLVQEHQFLEIGKKNFFNFKNNFFTEKCLSYQPTADLKIHLEEGSQRIADVRSSPKYHLESVKNLKKLFKNNFLGNGSDASDDSCMSGQQVRRKSWLEGYSHSQSVSLERPPSYSFDRSNQ